jgi:Ca2+-binding EF-hand superfamily protein
MFTKIATAAVLLVASSLAVAQVREGAVLDNADADHDGTVTRQEFSSARTAQFSNLDRNGDGVFDDSDAGGRGGKRAAALRSRLDANGDGKVTREEFVSSPAPMFDQFDTNHDDVLDAKELQAARKAAKQRLRGRRQ